MNFTRLLGIVVTGLIIGFAARGFYHQWSFDRAERIFELFAELCLAENPSSPESLGLVTHTLATTDHQWVDITSKSFLMIQKNKCSVTVFELNNLSLAEAKILSLKIAKVVQSDFPNLELESKSSRDGDSFERYWMYGSFRNPNRWGITIYASLPGSDNGSSSLNYFAHKN